MHAISSIVLKHPYFTTGDVIVIAPVATTTAAVATNEQNTMSNWNKYFTAIENVGGINYRSGTGGRCCIGARQTFRIHLPGGSTTARNDVVAAILKVWRQIENPTPSIDAYFIYIFIHRKR